MSGIIEQMQAEIKLLKERVNAIESDKKFYPVSTTLKERLWSPQQRRDEIVAKAKRDVEDLKTVRNLLGFRGYPYKDKLVTFADFIVNKDKRTVVALLRFQYEREVLSRGIAKCHPNDCFNVHIGKAIALRRALGLPVPDEYLYAPQPTEVRVGNVVSLYGEVRTVIPSDKSVGYGQCHIDSYRALNGKIIDDSHE